MKAETRLKFFETLLKFEVGTKKIEQFLGDLEKDNWTRSPDTNLRAVKEECKRKGDCYRKILKKILNMKKRDAEKDLKWKLAPKYKVNTLIKKQTGRNTNVTKKRMTNLRKRMMKLKKSLEEKLRKKITFLRKKYKRGGK